MPAIIFALILTVAGLSNLVTGNYPLGLCRLAGVGLSILATVLIMPAYTAAATSGGFSFLFILVYLPLALGEITGRVITERALLKPGTRLRTISTDQEPDKKA